jgi:hypothetical protein
MLEREEFDLVAVGRALLTDPTWVDKIRDSRTDELVALYCRYIKNAGLDTYYLSFDSLIPSFKRVLGCIFDDLVNIGHVELC